MAVQTRVEDLARRFEETADTFIDLVEACPPEGWLAICPDQGWSVGRTAEHVAQGMLFEVDYVLRIANGRALRQVTMDMIHAGNAASAAERANPDRAETLALLRTNRDRAAGIVRRLRDDQLDNSAAVPFLDNRDVTAAGLTELLLIGHIQSHMEGARAALVEAR